MSMRNKNEKQNEVKHTKNDVKEKGVLDNGTVRLMETVVCDCISEERDRLYLGPERLVRTYAITTLPQQVQIGFFNEILATVNNATISVYVEPLDNGTVIRELTSIIVKMKSNVKDRGEPDYALLQAIKDVDDLREAIQTGRDKMFYIQILINIFASDENELRNRCEEFEKLCARKGIKPFALVFEQKDSFITSLPIMNLKVVNYVRNVTTGGLICMTPTGNTRLMHNSGIFLGYNMLTGSLVFYDHFNMQTLTNPHMFVCGTSGAGKSVTLKLIAARSAAVGRHVIILDPEREYEKLVNMLGGQYIDIKAGEKTGINPFEIEVESDESGHLTIDLYSKVSEIKSLISTFVEQFGERKLTPEELSILDKSILELYAERGITTSPDSLYENVQVQDGRVIIGKVKKRLPTLSDLKKKLYQHETTKKLAQTIEILTGNQSLAIFDCETTIDLKSRIIGFNLKNFEKDPYLKFFAIVNIMAWIWNKYANYKVRNVQKTFICDESWMFAKYAPAVEFLENLARRGRKYGISMILATQQAQDFLRTESGQNVMAQCNTKFFLKQEPTIVNELAEYFKLSEACARFMYTFGKGEGILFNGNELALIKIVPFDFEWDVVRTDVAVTI